MSKKNEVNDEITLIKIKIMKARKRNSNDDWEEVEYVQLKNSYVITKADQMEFDTPVNSASTEEQHWQDVRERAAIAAMQGILCSPIVEGVDPNPSQKRVAEMAVMQANLLIEHLKEK